MSAMEASSAVSASFSKTVQSRWTSKDTSKTPMISAHAASAPTTLAAGSPLASLRRDSDARPRRLPAAIRAAGSSKSLPQYSARLWTSPASLSEGSPLCTCEGCFLLCGARGRRRSRSVLFSVAPASLFFLQVEGRRARPPFAGLPTSETQHAE